MATATSIIETGVDKLVKLVNSKGSISTLEASKQLGVSNTVVMEWAGFLEEEGIIKVEYKLTTQYLVARKLGVKEVKEKAKEFTGKKDIFIRKAEGTLSFLEKEASKLNDVKIEFDKIEKEIGFDLSTVKNELEELEKYEKLKINLDKKIEEQKRTSIDKIEALGNQVIIERQRYDEILSDLKKGQIKLENQKREAFSLEESEKLIGSRLNSLKEIIKKVENRLQKEGQDVSLSEKNIQKISLLADNVKSKIENEKILIEHLIKQSDEQSKKIKELQNKVVNKIAEKEKKLESAKSASKRIKELFKKKVGVLDTLEKINKDRNDLQNELIALIKKAKSFQISSKSRDVAGKVLELEKKFGEVEAKKKKFERGLKGLSSFFK